MNRKLDILIESLFLTTVAVFVLATDKDFQSVVRARWEAWKTSRVATIIPAEWTRDIYDTTR